jgi:hypothetical protein
MIDLVNYKTIVFHHIPKTAGTTLYGILDEQYSGKIHTINGNQLEHEKSLSDFIHSSDEYKKSIGLVKGHRLYGVDQNLSQSCAYITIVRDPAKRFISSYYQMLKVKPELPERIDFIKNKLTLAEYIERGDIYYGYNSQIKSFLNLVDPELEITQAHLNNAIEIAKRDFLLVGITERFYETIVLLNHIKGINITHFSSKNIGFNYNSTEVSHELIDKYDGLNKMDRMFFHEIEKIFQEKINSTPNFDKMLLEFRVKNERKNKMIQLKNKLIKPLLGIKKLFRQ